MVSGNGFDLIQRAMMKVQPSPDEFSHNSPPEEVRAGVITLRKSSGWRQPCNLNELAALLPFEMVALKTGIRSVATHCQLLSLRHQNGNKIARKQSVCN